MNNEKIEQLKEIASKIKQYIYSAADRENNIKIIMSYKKEISQLIDDKDFHILIEELKSNKWIARRGIELISLIRKRLWKEYYIEKERVN